MSKTTKAFDKIAAGLEDAIAIAQGRADPTTYRVHIPSSVDVRAIRKRMGLTQSEFSARFGLPVGSVRDWEQGRANPEPATRAYLKVIDHKPEAVLEALSA